MATILGKQVRFGIPSGIKSSVETLLGEGIVTDFSIKRNRQKDTLQDEQNETVSIVFTDETNECGMTLRPTGTGTLPAPGQQLTGIGTVDGINFDQGLCIVDEGVEIKYANKEAVSVSMGFTHYPAMTP